jgi:hypothetical protein
METKRWEQYSTGHLKRIKKTTTVVWPGITLQEWMEQWQQIFEIEAELRRRNELEHETYNED